MVVRKGSGRSMNPLRYVRVAGQVFAGVTKLGAVYVRCGFMKRAAVRRFEQELRHLGLPDSGVQDLTHAYADMVNLNPIVYARRIRSH